MASPWSWSTGCSSGGASSRRSKPREAYASWRRRRWYPCGLGTHIADRHGHAEVFSIGGSDSLKCEIRVGSILLIEQHRALPRAVPFRVCLKTN